MNIIVSLKAIRAELVNGTSSVGDKFILNPYDLYALQSVLDLRVKANIRVNCLSMGGNSIMDTLIRCYALGADQVTWLQDTAFAGSDTVATSYILSEGVKKIGTYDLIVCGEKTLDGETGQIPGGIASRLGIRYISGVKEILEVGNGFIIVRTQDEQVERKIRVTLPAVIGMSEFTTVTNKLSLLALKRAQNKEITIYTAKDLGVDMARCGLHGSKTKVLNVASSFAKKEGVIVEGDVGQKAKILKGILFEKGVH